MIVTTDEGPRTKTATTTTQPDDQFQHFRVRKSLHVPKASEARGQAEEHVVVVSETRREVLWNKQAAGAEL